MTRILALTGSHKHQEIVDLDISSTSEAAERVLDGNIPVAELHGFIAIDWAGRYGTDCTLAVANLVADGIVLLRETDGSAREGFDEFTRGVIAWTETVISASWDHDRGEFRDDRALVAAINASHREHYHIAAE